METQTENQTALEVTNNFKNIIPTHALVTNLQMKNGKQTAITTIFSCADFSFEEINRGVRDSLARQYWLPIDKAQAILYRLNNGNPEEVIKFFEEKYNR